jgi:hypothetical protein
MAALAAMYPTIPEHEISRKMTGKVERSMRIDAGFYPEKKNRQAQKLLFSGKRIKRRIVVGVVETVDNFFEKAKNPYPVDLTGKSLWITLWITGTAGS